MLSVFSSRLLALSVISSSALLLSSCCAVPTGYQENKENKNCTPVEVVPTALRQERLDRVYQAGLPEGAQPEMSRSDAEGVEEIESLFVAPSEPDVIEEVSAIDVMTEQSAPDTEVFVYGAETVMDSAAEPSPTAAAPVALHKLAMVERRYGLEEGDIVKTMDDNVPAAPAMAPMPPVQQGVAEYDWEATAQKLVSDMAYGLRPLMNSLYIEPAPKHGAFAQALAQAVAAGGMTPVATPSDNVYHIRYEIVETMPGLAPAVSLFLVASNGSIIGEEKTTALSR